ncbi:DUF268 domain-containing protein [Roseibium sp. M-1]
MGLRKKTKKILHRLGFRIYEIEKNKKLRPIYLQHKKLWQAQGGKIDREWPILDDYEDNAGVASGQYFHQDLLVARYIYEAKPDRHIDIGSRIDGFVAHVAVFREIEVLDVRPLPPNAHKNIIFRQADLMKDVEEAQTDSVSCLHALEHFGLGRYGDTIDVNGHIKGLQNIVKLLKPQGTLYVSFPIGKSDQVHFNAHRVFHPKSITKYDFIKNSLELKNFDYVDDEGQLHLNADLDEPEGKLRYGCGIYTFTKL